MSDRRAYQREYMRTRRADPEFVERERKQRSTPKAKRRAAAYARRYRDEIAGVDRASRCCAHCDGPIPPEKKSDAKYCSDQCQTDARNQRRRRKAH